MAIMFRPFADRHLSTNELPTHVGRAEVTAERPRGYAAEFRVAFLRDSSALMPGVTWRDLSEFELEYPEVSPVLGRLTVSFDWDEITVYFGPHHEHFMAHTGDVTERVGQIACQALDFITQLVHDCVIVRWGTRVSRTFSASRPRGIFGRMWRSVTPWVREAVWSGKPLA